jgi:hypothetical protein
MGGAGMRVVASVLGVMLSLSTSSCSGADDATDARRADAGAPSTDGGGVALDGLAPRPDGGNIADADASNASRDAATSSDMETTSDATTPSLCGNGVLDPGEVCDPSMIVHDDGGTHLAPAPGCAGCPDCVHVTCPTDSALVRNAYCVTRSALGATEALSWHDATERDEQLTASRTLTPGSTGNWSGYIALHHYGAVTGGMWYWQSAYWAPGMTLANTASFPPWSDPFGTGIYALLYVTPTSASLMHEPGTAGTSFLMCFPPNAP